MADSSNPYTKPHVPFSDTNSQTQQNPMNTSKSYTSFLFKALFFTLFLFALPLFPSQAPDFISETIFTKFWELFHLLFIGLAVSYGLFSQKAVNMDVPTSSNGGDRLWYESRLDYALWVFDDRYEKLCGSYEKTMLLPCNNQSVNVVDKGSYTFRNKSFHNSFGDLCEDDENHVFVSRKFQYLEGENRVVVANRSVIDEWGKSGSRVGYKPLGLPVRSLKSIIERPEPMERSESSSSSGESRYGKFGNLGPVNLEEKFNEYVALPSPILWHSRSMRMGMWGRSNVARASHFRPLSVDGTQFESLTAQSFQSKANFCSQTSSASSSSSAEPLSYSASSDMHNSEMEELRRSEMVDELIGDNWHSDFNPHSVNENLIGSLKTRSFQSNVPFLSESSSISSSPVKHSPTQSLSHNMLNLKTSERRKKKRFRGSSPASQSPPTTMDRKAPPVTLDFTGHKHTEALSEKDACKSYEDSRKGSNDRYKPQHYRDAKPAVTATRTSLSGKSVRTIRANNALKVGGASENQNDAKAGGNPWDEFEAISIGKTGSRGGRLETVSSETSRGKLNPNIETQKPKEILNMESDENGEREAQNFEVKSNKQFFSGAVSDLEADPDEVNKKADEFIAKFREQIRLQKMTSIGRLSSMSDEYFR